MTAPPFQWDDGGRAAAGFRGTAAGDCVTRAISIASGVSYSSVYGLINDAALRERPRKGRRRSSARTGVKIRTVHRVITELGGVWTPTMQIGTGCTVHVRTGELPAGRLVLNLSKHLCAFIDGTVHDLEDPSRDGTRCVYGYWTFPG